MKPPKRTAAKRTRPTLTQQMYGGLSHAEQTAERLKAQRSEIERRRRPLARLGAE